MEYLENRTYDEIHIGDSASLTRTLTEKDIQVFAIMSGDINPAHVDIEYAQSDMFHGLIGHGMWSGALISTVLGTQLPGPGTIYVGQTLRFKKPVAIGDTLTVKVTAIEKKEKNRVIFECKCHNQQDEIVMEGQAEVIAPSKKIRRPKAVLPEISLRRSMSLFDKYVDKAKSLGSLTTGVICPIHEKIIAAVHDAANEGFIEPILIGPKKNILHAAQIADIDISKYEIIDVGHLQSAINKAMQLAREGNIQALVRGGATRGDLIHAMQKPDKGIISARTMSHAFVLDVPTYPKALILTDTLINTNPHLDSKRGITQNAIDFAIALGVTKPKVAILAGSDLVTTVMPSTVDAAALCKMAERGQIERGILDGPLTFDDVISIASTEVKGFSSPVAGDADVLIVPNLETGNILAEQLEHLAESQNAGIVLGAKVPVLMSHIEDIRMSTISCAIAIIYHHYEQQRAEQYEKEVDTHDT